MNYSGDAPMSDAEARVTTALDERDAARAGLTTLHATLALCQAERDRLKRRVDLLESRTEEWFLRGQIDTLTAQVVELQAGAAEQERRHRQHLDTLCEQHFNVAVSLQAITAARIAERDMAWREIERLKAELAKGPALERLVMASR